MANQKLIFSNDGTIKSIDNYVLSKEEESFLIFIKLEFIVQEMFVIE